MTSGTSNPANGSEVELLAKQALDEVITSHHKVVATDNHPWLARDSKVRRGSRYRWVKTPGWGEFMRTTQPQKGGGLCDEAVQRTNRYI